MGGFEVHESDDAGPVLGLAGAYLAGDPVAHNVVLTILHERAAHPEPGSYWWVTVGDHVVGVALQSPPGHAASITPMAADALDALVPVMARTVPGLPGVLGDAATAAGFAGRWTEVTGSGAAARDGQRLYRLASLRVPSGVSGGPRPAAPDDLELVLSWWRGLAADTGEEPPGADGDAVVARRIEQGEIWMWTDDDRPVSMARLSPPAAGAVRVGFVYTPPECRRRGYAAASVAALSAHGLRQGAQECLLYTQLSNPTSNGVYRRIGYQAVGEILAYRFDPAESPGQPR